MIQLLGLHIYFVFSAASSYWTLAIEALSKVNKERITLLSYHPKDVHQPKVSTHIKCLFSTCATACIQSRLCPSVTCACHSLEDSQIQTKALSALCSGRMDHWHEAMSCTKAKGHCIHAFITIEKPIILSRVQTLHSGERRSGSILDTSSLGFATFTSPNNFVSTIECSHSHFLNHSTACRNASSAALASFSFPGVALTAKP